MATLDSVFAKQYGANVYMCAQQKGSKLRPYVTVESMRGEVRFFDRVKPTHAVRSSGRYSDTPLIPTEFDHRALRASEFIWADMIDWQDDMNLFIDPTSPIVEMGGYAMGRIIDEIIIENAFTGNGFEGEDGLTPVSFPSSQQLSITVGGTGGASAGLNIEKLIQTRSLFGKNDVDLEDPRNELTMAVTQSQLDDLLRTTQVTNSDYNSIKALVDGTVSRFMGINFVRTGLLPKTVSGDGYSRTCCCWAKSGIVLGIPKEISMSVSQRNDKCDNWQALAKMKCGATRIEDKKVVQVFCYED